MVFNKILVTYIFCVTFLEGGGGVYSPNNKFTSFFEGYKIFKGLCPNIGKLRKKIIYFYLY